MQTFDAENLALAHPLVDGHTHIDQYAPADLPSVLRRAHQANVGLIIAAGTTVASCRRVLALAESHPIVHAGVGLHPADLAGPVDDAAMQVLRSLAAHPKVVEWSETGLDYMPGSPGRGVQQDAFRLQIRMARELGLPMVTHSREADEDTLRLLREEHADDVGGAWHYFGGDHHLAQRIIELGFYISLAKPLLRVEPLQQVAARLPLDRVVIETDSFPQPFKKYRERWTEPWHLPQVAGKLAELQGVDAETVAEVTTHNYLRMLGGRIAVDQLPLPTDTP